VAAELLPSVAALRLSDGAQRQTGAGSGVLVSADGLVVTAAHVVRNASGGTAAFTNGEEVPFTVVGSDPVSDLAVVRAAGNGYQPARLGDASRLRVGQVVVAIGNPFGFEGSVSAGVVSALGRSLLAPTGPGSRLMGDVIQTDAALHPGNSGGALANSAAEVVGINTALIGPFVGQGLGMAVPVNDRTRTVIGTLAAGHRVRRAYLGIGGGTRPLAPALGAATGFSRGVEVMSVVASSPAGAAGLRPRDVIVSLDGEPVGDVGELQSLLTERFIGRPLTVGYIRDGRLATCTATCAELVDQ
jgi:S1-C subfamily serine protease